MSEKFSVIIVLLSNISDKLTEIIETMPKIQEKHSIDLTKTTRSIKEPITKEDYD